LAAARELPQLPCHLKHIVNHHSFLFFIFYFIFWGFFLRTDLQSHQPFTMLSTSKLLAMVMAVAAFANGQAPTKINDFNAGPTKLGMYAYVPKNLKSPAPIVVAIHHCQGSATGYAQETKYQPLADKHGFIVIYPNSKSSGGCFDVASPASESTLSPRVSVFIL
jgi:hypothetical protein